MSIRALTPKLQARAIKDLNEVPSRVEEDLQALEEWLEKQPHLYIRKDRQWLVAFLRCCKYSLQRSKEKLDFFYTIKTVVPEIFSNKDPMLPEIQKVLERKVFTVLVKTSEEANLPLIMMMKWANTDPKVMHFLDIVRTVFMSIDVMLQRYDTLTISGQYVVCDMKNFPLGYITQLSPGLCKKITIAYTNAYPNRIKGIYFINAPAIYETFINMFKVFMSDKLVERIKILRDEHLPQLFEYIPSHVFPKEYSGEGQTWDELNREWRQILESHREWLLEDDKHFSDESRRLGKPQTSADLFGIEGSFRKLNID